MKICCHCHQPLVADGAKWEATKSSCTTDGVKVFVVHEHLRCAIEADRVQLGRAIAAIAEAERSGVA